MSKTDRARTADSFIQQVLGEIGYHRSWWVRYRIAIGLAIIAVIAIMMYALTSLGISNRRDVDIASATIALSALLFAYQQWSDTKHESSIDKYYERLNLTNERLKDPGIRCELSGIFPAISEETFETKLYVYLELDNLEFSILKYRYGYMSSYMAYRSLLTFLSRCRSEQFLGLAKEAVDGSIGYLDFTRHVISNIASSDKQRWLKENVSSNLPFLENAIRNSKNF